MDSVRQSTDSVEVPPKGSRKIWNDLPVLFLALVPMLIIVPVLPPDPSSRPFILIFLTLLFIAGIYGMRGSRRRFLLSCILALIAIETFWVSVWPSASSLFLPAEFFLLLFLGHMTGYLVLEMVSSDGGIMDIISGTAVLVMIGGIMLGTGLHLSAWISRTVLYDPALLHSTFARSLPEGVMHLTWGGEYSSGTSPLTTVLLMTGSVCGFLILALAAGKIAGYYCKKSG